MPNMKVKFVETKSKKIQTNKSNISMILEKQ